MKWLAAIVLALAAPVAGAAEAMAPAAMSPGAVSPEDVVLDSAYFGSSSASLTWDGYELLRAVAAAMQANQAMRLEVEGHSDTSASATINVPLSKVRANVVRDFLIELGVDPARLVARGYGAWRPVNDNATLEKRSWNRRVQFRRLDQP